MMQTINDYLQILDNYTFSDRTITRVLIDRGITSGVTATSVEERLRDLAKSDMYVIAANLANKGGGMIKFGTQSKTESSIQVSEETRSQWLQSARNLRDKWGEDTSIYTGQIYDATGLWN